MHVNINFKQLWCTGTASLSPLLSLFHNSISLFGFCHMVVKMPEVLLCVWVRKRRRGRIWEWYRAMCMLSISTKNVTLSLENKQHERKMFSVMLQNYLTLISEVCVSASLIPFTFIVTYIWSVSFTSKWTNSVCVKSTWSTSMWLIWFLSFVCLRVVLNHWIQQHFPGLHKIDGLHTQVWELPPFLNIWSPSCTQ